jgi:hypothetical protein
MRFRISCFVFRASSVGLLISGFKFAGPGSDECGNSADPRAETLNTSAARAGAGCRV